MSHQYNGCIVCPQEVYCERCKLPKPKCNHTVVEYDDGTTESLCLDCWTNDLYLDEEE